MSCVGILGDLFGHKFRTFEVSSEPPKEMPAICGFFNGVWEPSDVIEAIEAMTTRRSVVKCVRCGDIA